MTRADHDGRIRLMFVIDCLNIGGTEKQLVELIRRLDRQRFDIHLCVLRDTEYLEGLQLDCNVHVLNLDSILSFNGLRKLLSLAGHIRRAGIQLVQTFFIDANIVGTLAARLGGARHVISSRREMVYWYTPMIRVAFWLLKPFTTRYLANSGNVRTFVAEQEGLAIDRIDVLYNGIDLSAYTVADDTQRQAQRRNVGAAADEVVIGIVSNLNRPVKRVDIFIRAAAAVLAEGARAYFVIVGEGYLRQELAQLADELGIGAKVHFAGSQANVVPYMQSFDIAVNSSESEGFSNAVLEYMACGAPVVATSFGGSAESVIDGETGLLVAPNDAAAMARAILQLLNDVPRARAMGRRGRAHVEKSYEFDVVVARQEQYYFDIVAGRRTD